MEDTFPFFSFIENLRLHGKVVLYNDIPEITEEEYKYVVEFLKREYEQECKNFPYSPPAFDGNAAGYSARIMYILAQLLLFRKQSETEIKSILLPYEGEVSASDMLSADMLFRFLPDFELNFSAIDFEDAVLPFINELRIRWHYSNISSLQQTDGINFDTILTNPCLHQLYIDRIIENKNQTLAGLNIFRTGVNAVLGIYQKEFWNNYS